MHKLTPQQDRALQIVNDFWQKHDVAPSIADVAGALGIIRATAYKHLNALKAKGYLQHKSGVGRSWRPTQLSTSHTILIPLLGQVAAGLPMLAAENIEDHIQVEKPKGQASLFALRVKGKSMIEGGILENDVVIVREQPSADNGDIIVALIDGETATVKKFQRKNGRVHLIPMNHDYETMEFMPSRVSILGKVVEVRRWL